MQQRYYDPVIGRFYSNDPVGFSADSPMMFNRYAYANNNPYKFTDPDGRKGALAIPVRPPVVSSVSSSQSSGISQVQKYASTSTASQERSNDKVTVYRGVDKGHGSYREASLGAAMPRGGNAGHTDANAHSAGRTEDSAFTSWTTSKEVAHDFATNDVGEGVILTKDVPLSDITLPSTHFDPSEQEVLLKGTVFADNTEQVKGN